MKLEIRFPNHDEIKLAAAKLLQLEAAMLYQTEREIRLKWPELYGHMVNIDAAKGQHYGGNLRQLDAARASLQARKFMGFANWWDDQTDTTDLNFVPKSY